ncbi:MAG: hypothetical protein IT337_14295, partial [Thermomicrobiales bacterium]|nr:hypothetical protein [Thermomicrobiales bacterium]
MSYVLGVDGGNTKTIALVASDDGVIAGCGRAGGSDIYGAASVAAALAELDAAVATALDKAELRSDQIARAAFSMAGADWPEDFDLLRAELRARGYEAEPVIVNDAIGALRAGSPDGTGVVLAAGTGMAIGARAPGGREWHSGNWPTAGGGSGLGRAALDAVFGADLGVAPPTTLSARVVAYFDADSVEDVLYRITHRGSGWSWQATARLAPLALDEADRDDPVAAGI